MRSRGFTLVELLLVVGIVALLAAVGMPSYADLSARQRLAAASEQLAAELQQARFDAVQGGRDMHVSLRGGPQWCYAVSLAPGCDCKQPAATTPAACALRRGDAQAHPDVQLTTERTHAVFDARMGRAAPGVVARLSVGERSAEVQLTPSGRARACGRGADLPGLPRC